MSHTLVPQPKFFDAHKKEMCLIMQKSTSVCRLYSKDLDEYVSALSQREDYYESMVGILNPDSKNPEEKAVYRHFRDQLSKVRSMKTKVSAMQRNRDQIRKRQDQLSRNIDDSNKILDTIVRSYQDAR